MLVGVVSFGGVELIPPKPTVCVGGGCGGCAPIPKVEGAVAAVDFGMDIPPRPKDRPVDAGVEEVAMGVLKLNEVVLVAGAGGNVDGVVEGTLEGNESVSAGAVVVAGCDVAPKAEA